VGVYKSGVTFETGGVVVSNAVIQRTLKMPGTVAMAWLYLKEGADKEAVQRAVEQRFPSLSAIRTDEFTDFYNQLEYIDWFVWIISLVSVAVGGLGVLNTMLMSVSERTREIGTLRAVGWSQAMVLKLILSEGVAISVLGGLVGLAVGTSGAELLIQLAPPGFLSTKYSGQLFGIAMAVAVGLGFVAALYPAVRASRLSPIEALKYE
jgi:putative ABC transport system permease protein